jgi:hypothetical protein
MGQSSQENLGKVNGEFIDGCPILIASLPQWVFWILTEFWELLMDVEEPIQQKHTRRSHKN